MAGTIPIQIFLFEADMTAAAFSGEYTDLRFVKTRSVCQITVEIPIEKAAEFVAAFGTPVPAQGCLVALARLDLSAVVQPKLEPPKERRRFNELNPAQQAGIRCNDEAFWKYMSGRSRAGPVHNSNDAALMVRDFCGVSSRAELATDDKAAERWYKLDNAFNDWLRMPEHVV